MACFHISNLQKIKYGQNDDYFHISNLDVNLDMCLVFIFLIEKHEPEEKLIFIFLMEKSIKLKDVYLTFTF